MTTHEIENLIKPYVDRINKLECDGATRVISYILTQNQVEHQIFMGSVEYVDEKFSDQIPLHFWIELSNNVAIDYIAIKWLPKGVECPIGFFDKAQWPHILYEGDPTESLRVDKIIFDLLTTTRP